MQRIFFVWLIAAFCIISRADPFRLPDSTIVLSGELSWTLSAQAVSKIAWLKGLILARAAYVTIEEGENGTRVATINLGEIKPSLLNLIVKIAQEKWTAEDVADCLSEGQTNILGQLELWGVETPPTLVQAMPVIPLQAFVSLEVWHNGVCLTQLFYMDCPVCAVRWWWDSSAPNLDNVSVHLSKVHPDCRFKVDRIPLGGASGWVQPSATKVSIPLSHTVLVEREDWGSLLLLLQPNSDSNSHFQELFRNAAYLSLSVPQPDMRRLIAAHAMRAAHPFFRSVPDWVLNFANQRFHDFLNTHPDELAQVSAAQSELRQAENAQGQLMLAEFQRRAADCIACRVMQNVFPRYTRRNAELERIVPTWRQRVMSHRANIAREILRGVQTNRLPEALTLPVRNMLVSLLSAIPMLNFGIPLIKQVLLRY